MNSRQAERLYQRLGRPVPSELATPSASKFNARRKEVDGILFDSTGEARAYQLLKLWERAGAISGLVLQPEFGLQPAFHDRDGKLHRKIVYRADFQFQRNGRTVVIDFKGVRLPAYLLKLKMFRATNPDIEFEEWTKETLASQ